LRTKLDVLVICKCCEHTESHKPAITVLQEKPNQVLCNSIIAFRKLKYCGLQNWSESEAANAEVMHKEGTY